MQRHHEGKQSQESNQRHPQLIQHLPRSWLGNPFRKIPHRKSPLKEAYSASKRSQISIVSKSMSEDRLLNITAAVRAGGARPALQN
jgi:hypothetical protein